MAELAVATPPRPSLVDADLRRHRGRRPGPVGRGRVGGARGRAALRPGETGARARRRRRRRPGRRAGAPGCSAPGGSSPRPARRAALERATAAGADAVVELRGRRGRRRAGRSGFARRVRAARPTSSSTRCSASRARPRRWSWRPAGGWSTSAAPPGRRLAVDSADPAQPVGRGARLHQQRAHRRPPPRGLRHGARARRSRPPRGRPTTSCPLDGAPAAWEAVARGAASRRMVVTP